MPFYSKSDKMCVIGNNIDQIKGVALKKILTLSCLSLMMVACTQTDPAEIQDVSDSSGGTTSSVYTKPPANISTGGQVSSSSPTTYSSPSPSVQSSRANEDNSEVVTTQDRIVYNRNYDDIPKGGYEGDSYTVKRGDTLFYIAWMTGNDYRSLAAKNNIKEPYAVNVGQVLDVSGGAVVVTQKTTANHSATANNTALASTSTQAKVKPVITTTTTTTTTTSGKTQPTETTKTTKTVTEPLVTQPILTNTTPIDSNTASTANTTSTTSASAARSNVANISWQWPAKGKIIEKFSSASKGIDISGSLGDKVVAAADGRVVYSGNALPGYGNLIIVKHNDDYLTAYAHNQSILVKEQQAVKAGQQIATMGATGTSTVRLHFEIRYKAQSVDPLKYLPN